MTAKRLMYRAASARPIPTCSTQHWEIHVTKPKHAMQKQSMLRLMFLSAWLDKWLDEYMAATLRHTTLNGYRRSLELHVKP